MWIFGASGHAKVVAEIAEKCDYVINGFIDDDTSKTNILEYNVIHQFADEPEEIFVAVGDNSNRKKITKRFNFSSFPKLIHPNTSISSRAFIDEGTVVMAGVTINVQTIIGKHCIINTNSSIDHDCSIGDYVHICPNATLAGNVKVGEGAQIGIGATIIQGVTIGKWCTIGAGSVIIKDVPDGATVVGNPGKIIKMINSNSK